jgi:hypothetical protein
MVAFDIALHCVKRRLSGASCLGIQIYLRIGPSSIGRMLQGVENWAKLSGGARTGVKGEGQFQISRSLLMA